MKAMEGLEQGGDDGGRHSDVCGDGKKKEVVVAMAEGGAWMISSARWQGEVEMLYQVSNIVKFIFVNFAS